MEKSSNKEKYWINLVLLNLLYNKNIFLTYKLRLKSVENSLTDKNLRKSDKGIQLLQLFTYENETATTVAKTAVEILEDALVPDLNLIAKKMVDSAKSVIEVFGQLRKIEKSLTNLQNQKVAKVPIVSARPVTYRSEGPNHKF